MHNNEEETIMTKKLLSLALVLIALSRGAYALTFDELLAFYAPEAPVAQLPDYITVMRALPIWSGYDAKADDFPTYLQARFCYQDAARLMERAEAFYTAMLDMGCAAE